MNDKTTPKDGSLVPAGRRDVAPVAVTNSLVSRGLADIAQSRLLKVSETVQFERKNALTFYLQGAAYYQKEDHEKASKDLAEAIRLFSEIIRVHPSDAFSFRHRAKALWVKSVVIEALSLNSSPAVTDEKQDNYDKAMMDFDEAIRLDPSNAIAFIERGEAWYWGYPGDDPLVLSDFDEAIRLEPNNAAWYGLRGIVWLQDREYDKAIEDLIEAIRLNTETQPFVFIEFTTSAEQDTSFDDYKGGGIPTLSARSRINLFTTLAAAYSHRGQSFSLNEENDQAIRDFNEVIRLDPMNARAHLWRGMAWHSEGDHDNAIRDYDEALRLVPNDSTIYNIRGVAWAAKKDYDNAIKDYNEAIRLAPNDPINYKNRGHALEAKKDCDRAINDFDKADRLERRQRTSSVPAALNVSIPGVLSFLIPGPGCVPLAETPGIIEINSDSLRDAHYRFLTDRYDRRLEKLRTLNAPDLILQNEIKLRSRYEDCWKNAGDRPEDHAYHFKIEEEYFDESEFENAIVNLAPLTQLEHLDLSESLVTDRGLASLRFLANLRVLSLKNCQEITDQGLAHLSALAHLKRLVLGECSVTDRGLAQLVALKNLRYLNLGECSKITPGGISALKTALPHCDISCADF